jgi:hypothetical protein
LQREENLPSIYALKDRYPISPKSTRNSDHDMKLDHEKMTWIMNKKVNSRDDCHAWNLREKCPLASTSTTTQRNLLSLRRKIREGIRKQANTHRT